MLVPEVVCTGSKPPAVADVVAVVGIDRTDTAIAASWVATLTIGRRV